jgi:hypothetical protein
LSTDTNAVHHRLNDDLEFYAEHAPLLVKDKEGNLIKLRFNLAQKYIHAKLEEQRKAKGWVRALILKGRQQGCSTYVNARFYHKTTRRPHMSAFILSHEGDSTTALFSMVKRYHEHVSAAFKPQLGKDNPRAMDWPGIGSDYSAATAKNDQAGRSRTAQLFHGSEVAYYEYAYAVQDGALKIVSLVPGTEIILESTANGPKGLFYEKCQQALKGETDYQLIFVPWFFQEEYEREAPVGFTPTEEEEAYIEANLVKPFPFTSIPITRAKALRKIAWRRAEVLDLSTEGGGNPELGMAKFRTIFPANPVEAFQSSGVGLFRPDAIAAARASKITDPDAPLVAGVDAAGDSDNSDRTVISLRRGRRIEERLIFLRMRPMELAGIIAREVIEKRKAEMVFIDRGYGEGTIDRLLEMGFGRRVIGIAFNERPLNPDIYMNKRSEIICEYAKWINAGGVRIPDDDVGHAALACVPLDEVTSNGLKFLKSKREIKRALGGALLLDIVDADALTFSYPVRRGGGNGSDGSNFRKAESKPGFRKVGGPLKALSRMRGRTR